MTQRLLIVQNGRQHSARTESLKDGAIGNLRTLAVMSEMVREDAAVDLELRRRAEDLIEGCEPRDFDCEVGKLFEFARAVRYVSDPLDVERIADAATTIVEQAGDCGDKAILLASMLGSVGYTSRFVAVNFYGDVESHGYDHVYIEVQRADETWLPLDATPENAPPGWEAKAVVRSVYEIWTTTAEGVSGIIDTLIGQGVSFGTGLAQGAIQSSRLSHAQETQVGAQFDNLDRQVAQLFTQLLSLPSITVDQATAAVNAVQQLAAFAQQYASVSYVASQWQSEAPRYNAALEGLAAKLPSQSAPVANNSATPAAGNNVTTVVGGWLSNPMIVIALVVAGVFVVKSMTSE